MKILIGCERSGVVRRAFEQRGHDAWSCDIEPCIDGSLKHIQGDLLDVCCTGEWDMMIAHPPCTYLSYAGARWDKVAGRKDEQQKAIFFFYLLLHAPIEKIALENPRGLVAKLIRRPDDVIQPYEFGHHVSKRTYLWLKNLPPLMRTYIDLEYEKGWTKKQHGFARSITFSGIAEAMAAQWGKT
jgi:site-specific DNA-cytosine methylase